MKKGSEMPGRPVETAVDRLREPILGERENIIKEAMLEMIDVAITTPVVGVEANTNTKWVDGNDIFAQTFAMTTPGIGDILLAHQIAGLDLIVKSIEGYIILEDGTKATLPVVGHDSAGGGGGGGSAANTITLVEWDATNLLGFVGSNYVLTKAVASLVFTIHYTKTA